MLKNLLVLWHSLLRKLDAIILELMSPLARIAICENDDPITICVGIKNRTKPLIEQLINSLNNAEKRDKISLSIIDCHTDDVPDLKTVIERHWKGNLIFSVLDEEFSRTRTLNAAVKQAKTKKVFVCDADMSLPVDFVDQFNKNVDSDDNIVVWFPICYSLYRTKPQKIKRGNGWWRREGWGMMGITKCLFETVNGYDETNVTWGGEDNDILKRLISSTNALIVRSKSKGLFHNWHPYGKFGGNNHKTTR